MIGKLVFILILLISIGFAETVPLTFKTPENWIKSEGQNDSQVVLKDGNSVIRIDIFNVDNNTWNGFKPVYWNKSGLEYINAEKAVEMYRNYINLNSYKFLSKGIGPSTVAPDGVQIVASWANYGTLRNGTLIRPKSIIWLIAWTKPEYKNKIVGIYGNITGSYPEHDYYPDGTRIPQPIWDVLESIHVLGPTNVTSLIDVTDPINDAGADRSDHWDFEGGIGQGWRFEGIPQWLLDCNERHTGSCSMRSGEILPFSGPTSVWREVQGPVIVSFWWKADSLQVCTDPSMMCKGLFFLVDGKTQMTCNSSDWKEAKFPLTDGLHRVEWIFKPRSDRKGVGWLDDVSLAPFPTSTETAYENHNISFQVPVNWRLTRDIQIGNDTSVMLNNGVSSIKIDIVGWPLLPTLRSISKESTLDYLLMDQFTKTQNDRTRWENLTGSSKVHPDGLPYVSFQSTENSTLMFAWTKPEYGDRYIVVKGNFLGPQDVVSLYGYYGCPVDLVNLLNSFRTKFGGEGS